MIPLGRTESSRIAVLFLDARLIARLLACVGCGALHAGRLGEFDEHAAGGLGVDEGDAAAVRAGNRGLVDEPYARGLEPGQFGVNVVNFEAEMVDAGPVLLDGGN